MNFTYRSAGYISLSWAAPQPWSVQTSLYAPAIHTPFIRWPPNTTRQQLRLLRLLQTSKEERRPAYELHTFDIKESPAYKALSYTWGVPSPICTIYVDSLPLLVRPNLYDFLHRYTDTGYVWIDQISSISKMITRRITRSA